MDTPQTEPTAPPKNAEAARGHVLDEARVAELLTVYQGNLAAVARACGVVRSAVSKFVGRRKHLRDLAIEARQTMIDHAESALHAAILRGEGWAVCFYLKTQGRDRGYSQVVEITRPRRPRYVL